MVIVGGRLAYVRPDFAGRVSRVITAEGIAERLAGLESIGIGAAGASRMAWSDEDAATRSWFAEQARTAG